MNARQRKIEKMRGLWASVFFKTVPGTAHTNINTKVFGDEIQVMASAVSGLAHRIGTGNVWSTYSQEVFDGLDPEVMVDEFKRQAISMCPYVRRHLTHGNS